MDFQTTPIPRDYHFSKPLPKKDGFYAARILKPLIIFGIALAILATVLFLFLRNPFNIQGMEFKLEGQSEASAGEELVYKIRYKNNTGTEFEKIRLSFFYPPESIILREGGASDVLSERIDINNLKPQEEGQLELRLFLVGNKGDTKTAKAIISFKPLNIRSEFQKEATLATTITSVPVSLTLSAPPNAAPGQKISYILDYRNESGNDISNARFEFTYPNNFSPKLFLPPPSVGTTIWDISKLKKGQGERIKIEGVISGNEGESKTVSAALRMKINNTFITYEKADSSTVLAKSPLELTIKVNNLENYISFPGDQLEYVIDFKNNTSQDLSGINISARLLGPMFDISTLSSDGVFDDQTKSISWNASLNQQLGTLRASENGQLTFRIKINDSFPQSGLGSKDFFVKVVVRGSASSIPQGFAEGEEITAENEIVTRLSQLPGQE